MEKIFKFIFKSRLSILVLALIISGFGFYSYKQLPVDAFPDVSPSLVQVFVETDGLAPEEVEKYVTYPIEIAMNGIPNLKKVRSISNFGLAVINLYFDDGTDIYFARQLVGERLVEAKESIPEGFGEPVMGPITTGLGQILFYVLIDESKSKTKEEMRSIQDWLIKTNIQTVSGVTEVLSLGGEVKQFHVNVRPSELIRFNLSINDIVDAIKSNNSNISAQFLVENSEEYIIRSIGLANKVEDLENIVLKTIDGVSVHLHQVAELDIGGEVRRGLATMNGEGEVVVGMILKLIGTNTTKVIEKVKNQLNIINKSLPDGVKVVPYYDQATLVQKCIKTVTDSLIFGILFVIVILFLFMGGARPSLVVALSIPFSILFTFLFMKIFNISANLMSLGGLAIGIGMLVDGTIVIVENIDRIFKEDIKKTNSKELILKAALEVGKPIVFAIAIIIIVFLPLFSLQGVEGKTFIPLAQTISLAMLGSLIYAIFIAPIISFYIMKKHPNEKELNFSDRIISFLWGIYRPILEIFIKKRKYAIILSVFLLALGGFIFPQLGSEFVPKLNEGDLLVRVTMAPSISLEEATKVISIYEKKLLRKFPEVEKIVTRIGRGEVGAHADPVNSAESFVALKPQERWTGNETPEELYARMSKYFEKFPGAKFNFTQPIAAAVDELLTGTKAELAIKIFGPDLETLRKKASEVQQVIKKIKGAADVQMDQVTGTPQIRLVIKRNALARYGINISELQEIIGTAIGGTKAGFIFEDVARRDIIVRYKKNKRNSKKDFSKILVPSKLGARVPLSELVNIEEIVGPRQITRENNQKFISVQCNVRNRDMGSFVKEAQNIIENKIELPTGYFISWGGQFQLQQEANNRLMIVIPITLFLVFILLFGNFNSLKSSVLIILNIPLALVGGVVGLWITNQNLSVPASVGFIALFGIALENGMVLVTYLNELRQKSSDIDSVSLEAAKLRMRPVLMTAMTTSLGLIPLLLSTGTGSEVQRPLATVVIGGIITSTLLTLLVIPAIYKWFSIERENLVQH